MTDKTMTLEQAIASAEHYERVGYGPVVHVSSDAWEAITRHLSQPAERGENVEGPLLTYAVNFMDGWLEDERDEVLNNWSRVREAALSKTAKPPAAGVPDGWKLVPIKMTEEMQRAGSGFNYIENAWNAVLAATPSPTIDVAAVHDWQRNCPDYPNCPNLSCMCDPANRPNHAIGDAK